MLAPQASSNEAQTGTSNCRQPEKLIVATQAVPVLIAALEDGDDSVRWNAIGALEAFGHKAKAAVPALVQAVDGDEANGCFAAQALGAIDAEGVSTPALIEALGNQNPLMRRFAAIGLSRIGRKANSADQALHDGLQDSDLGARIASAVAYWSVPLHCLNLLRAPNPRRQKPFHPSEGTDEAESARLVGGSIEESLFRG